MVCKLKKERLILVGAGGFGRIVSEHVIKKYECFFVDDCYPNKKEVCGIPIIGKISDLPSLFDICKKLIVVIGNTELREKIYKAAERIGYIFPNIIADNVYISPFANIGKGCVFLNNVVVQNGANIGNGVLLNPGVEIHHDSSIGNYTLIYSNSVIRTYANVGNRVIIGSTCSVSVGAIVEDDRNIEDGITVKGD